MKLINWLWLEELLVKAAEAEVRAAAEAHPDVAFYAFALEFDPSDASVSFSYGTRADVEAAAAAQRDETPDTVCYRALELNPGHWRHRRLPVVDPAGAWARALPILTAIRENVTDNETDAEAVEFAWLRFEYLAESVAQQLIERDAFRCLRRAPEFIAFAASENEQLEELEDRLSKFYPNYNRAAADWAEHARPSDVQAELVELFEAHSGESAGELRRRVLRRRACQSGKCARHPTPRSTVRCTYCQRWFCDVCREGHAHPELSMPQPLFVL
jgi:hypothetical protein